MSHFLHARQPAEPMPAGLRDTREAMIRDAEDHTDLTEYLTGITEASALVVRLRQIAATCSRAVPLLEFAEAIDDAAYPLDREAARWDDARDARRHGDALDWQRMVRSA